MADQTACINVRLIGYQDTLLTDTRTKDENGNYAVTRQYFNKCYITGNVDFIYGAGTSVFEDCDIVARYTEYNQTDAIQPEEHMLPHLTDTYLTTAASLQKKA